MKVITCNHCKMKYRSIGQSITQATGCGAVVFQKVMYGSYGSALVDMAKYFIGTHLPNGNICDNCIRPLIKKRKIKKMFRY